MNFKEESIQLIATNQYNQFILTNQAKQLLFSIQKPIAIVTIAGMYRTGKSYLVNRLLKNKQNGFKTGSTTQSVTKGLSIWGRPIPAQDQQGNEMYYIVIDSQGIGSCQQEVKYDVKLLMLIFLISSTVVYNSMGAIDQLALDQLRVVVSLKQYLTSQPPNEKTKLVWVLRDFALQLIDKNGLEMSPNEYLEQCLEESLGTGPQVKKKNQIRRAIKQGLGKKCCYTLVRPTINEEDLQDLSKCKLRSEFINEIESIRQQVFRGSRDDLKRIGGSVMTGKLLIGLLEECIIILNSNKIPEMNLIWESVKDVANEQSFEELCNEMKKEICKLPTPMPKEQLKNKLNEIQNKYYNKLQNQYLDVSSFKKYHKQFLRMTQKLNKDIKKNNSNLVKEKVLKDIREFVKENISLQSIEPTNLTLVKVIIDRMELKVKGEPEGYQYVLSVLFDLMHISEQKAIYLQKQAYEQRKIIEMSSLEKKNHDMGVIAIKQDYHEALKTINNFKVTQQETEKQLALMRHHNQILEINLKNYHQESEIRESALIRQIEEANFKARQRSEQSSQLIKRLREQNSQLVCQMQTSKHQKLREGLNERKEVIFEQKMKQTWGKFDQQRKFLRTQLDKFRREVEIYSHKYEQQKRQRQKQMQQIAKERETFTTRERQYATQLLQIKNLHTQTKKTYTATFDAIKDNERVFRNIQNVSASNSKMASCKKGSIAQDKQIMKKYYQNQLQRVKNQHQDEINYLNQQLNKANKQYEQLRSRHSDQETQYKSCRQEKLHLENELIIASEKFADTLSEIESAKERERSIYQESIVRLLSNLDKRESQLNSFRR